MLTAIWPSAISTGIHEGWTTIRSVAHTGAKNRRHSASQSCSSTHSVSIGAIKPSAASLCVSSRRTPAKSHIGSAAKYALNRVCSPASSACRPQLPNSYAHVLTSSAQAAGTASRKQCQARLFTGLQAAQLGDEPLADCGEKGVRLGPSFISALADCSREGQRP